MLNYAKEKMGVLGFGKKKKLAREAGQKRQNEMKLLEERYVLGNKLYNACQKVASGKKYENKYPLKVVRLPDNGGGKLYSIFIGAEDDRSQVEGGPGYRGYSLYEVHVEREKEGKYISMKSSSYSALGAPKVFQPDEINTAIEFAQGKIKELTK